MSQMTTEQMLEELEKLRHPFHHQHCGDLPDAPALSGALQPMDRKLVHGHIDQVHVPGTGPAGRPCGDVRLWAARPQLPRLTFGDVIDAPEASPGPTILVMQQNFPRGSRTRSGWRAATWFRP